MALSANINVMLRAAEKAGKSLIRDFGEVEQLQVSRKGPGDFVTNADLRAEEILFKELTGTRPGFDFLMEERGEVKTGETKSEGRWIIDPLDGTSNFLHGLPHWNISIALELHGEVIAGIVYDPIRDEVFRAEKGQGAFLRNKRLRVSGRINIEDAMIVTGAPARTPAKRQQFLAEYSAMQEKVPGLRRYGAAALDLAYVAAGRFEGFWERDLKPWDMAAGCLIVREAGGRVAQINGQEEPVFNGNVLAANTALFDEMRKILASAQQEKDAA